MDRAKQIFSDQGSRTPEGFRCDYARFFPFWYKLTPGQQKRLAGYCTLRQFRTGENIYFHQICNGGMYFVYDGAIRIYMISPHGREATIYHRYSGQTGIVIPLYESRPENIIPVFQAEEDSTLAYIGHWLRVCPSSDLASLGHLPPRGEGFSPRGRISAQFPKQLTPCHPRAIMIYP